MMYLTGMLGVSVKKIGDFVLFEKDGSERRIYGTDEAHAGRIYQAAMDARQALIDEVNGQLEQELKYLLDTGETVEDRLSTGGFRVTSLLADQRSFL